MLHTRSRELRGLAGLVVAVSLGGFDLGVAGASPVPTADLEVSSGITSNCVISTTALTFGTYDPLVVHASSPAYGTGSLDVVCTLGSTATIMLGQGDNATGSSTESAPDRRMSDGAGHYLSYTIYSDSGRTTVWGNAPQVGNTYTGTGLLSTITVYGLMPGGQSAPAGAYADAVVATVSF